MQITYAGQIIATEPDFNGADTVQDFVPDGEQLAEWIEALRAEWATPRPFGNRKNVISGLVILSSQADLKTAMILRGTFYGSLPAQGDLVFQMDDQLLTFAGAVLKSSPKVTDQKGVSVGFRLTFWAGQGIPSEITASIPLVTDAGMAIPTDAGAPINLNPSS